MINPFANAQRRGDIDVRQNDMPQINKEKFKSLLPKVDQATLNNLIEEARNQGISESDIQAGLKFIKSLR